ncbi:MAG: hypothetical protein ACJA16_000140 [Akkermansiaceae bacterium]|jgi:hypothetical protein
MFLETFECRKVIVVHAYRFSEIVKLVKMKAGF